MPLMVPVADLIGMTRQTVVLAFNFGDRTWKLYHSNVLSAVANLMAACVSYGTWMKFHEESICKRVKFLHALHES